MRITQQFVNKRYMNSLNKTLGTLDRLNDKVIHNRKFLDFSENVSGGVRAFQIRRQMQKVTGYLDNLKTTRDLYTEVEASILKAHNTAVDAKILLNQAVNSTNGLDERQIIAQNIRSLADEVLANLNMEFSGRYMFGGSDVSSAPFIKFSDPNYKDPSDPGYNPNVFALPGERILYRGIDVETMDYGPPPSANLWLEDLNGPNSGGWLKLGGAPVMHGPDAAGFINPNIAGIDGITATGNPQKSGPVILEIALAPKNDPTDPDTYNILINGEAAVDANGDPIKFDGSNNGPVNVTVDGVTYEIDVNLASGANSTGKFDTGINIYGSVNDYINDPFYVDVGLALRFQSDSSRELLSQTALNVAFPGISVIGAGKSELTVDVSAPASVGGAYQSTLAAVKSVTVANPVDYSGPHAPINMEIVADAANPGFFNVLVNGVAATGRDGTQLFAENEANIATVSVDGVNVVIELDYPVSTNGPADTGLIGLPAIKGNVQGEYGKNRPGDMIPGIDDIKALDSKGYTGDGSPVTMRVVDIGGGDYEIVIDGVTHQVSGVSGTAVVDANGVQYQVDFSDLAQAAAATSVEAAKTGLTVHKSTYEVQGNLYLLMNQIADALCKEPSDVNYLNALHQELDKKLQDVNIKVTEMGAKVSYIESMIDRYDTQMTNLMKAQNEVEYDDITSTITDFEMQKAAYSAALAMGTKILETSIFNYMR